MDQEARLRKVMEWKERRGCERCGARKPARRLSLVRPDGTGLHFSRVLRLPALTDEELWKEVERRKVLCPQCLHRVPARVAT
jgi:hypothetical protein